MANRVTDQTEPTVTQDETWSFVREAFRNWEEVRSVPVDVLSDIEVALSAFVRHRLAAPPAPGEPVAWLYEGGIDGPFASVKRWPAGVCAAQGWTETPLYAHPPAATLAAKDAEIERAVLAERERCARIAEAAAGKSKRWKSPMQWAAQQIAVALRANPEQAEGGAA